MIRNDDTAIKLIGVVRNVLVGEFPPNLSRLPVSIIHLISGVDDVSLLGDERAYGVKVKIDIYTIRNGLLVRVLYDEVLMKETHRLLGWRCCESDQRGIEVLQHLPPLVIDGAMTLIRDDKVEGVNRDRRVIDDRLRGILEHFERCPG